MNDNLNEVLSVGSYGMVVRPSIDCSTGNPSSDYNTVGKIASLEDNQKEYDNIQNLPVFVNAPYITIDKISMCAIEPEWLSPYEELTEDVTGVREIYIESNKQLTQLTMPYLGLDFSRYIRHFKNPFVRYKYDIYFDIGKKIMDVYTLKRLMSAVNILYEQLEMVNEQNFYHKDIKLNNVIYDLTKNKFTLIDFGISSADEKELGERSLAKLYINEKIHFFKEFLNILIYTSFNNEYIYNSLLPAVKEMERLMSLIMRSYNMNFLPNETIDIESRRIEAKHLCNLYMEVITNAVNNLDGSLDKSLDKRLNKLMGEQPPVALPPPYVGESALHIPPEILERDQFQAITQINNENSMAKEDRLVRTRDIGRGNKRRTNGTKKRKTKNKKTKKPRKYKRTNKTKTHKRK